MERRRAHVTERPSAGCLDDDAVAAYVRRTLAEIDRVRAEDHLGACPACRAVVADVAWISTAEAENTSVSPEATREMVGRFVLLRRVGAGAFGTVYAAYDPTLDRQVALKIVRTDRLGRDPRRRILREAQAMARLSHPNVTAVYDVTSDGDEVCIAMELIHGEDGRSWLAARQRGRDEILGVFIHAGRGLAAAHAAGLVHRDFKPSNVLVGDDGRTSVTDFGLARAEVPEPSLRPVDGRACMSAATLTQSGQVVGTPRYMAPEQLRGETATARSDQFAFCVALWEALTGDLPFADLLALSSADAAITPRNEQRIPSWLRRPLLRGLQTDPRRRHPTMEPLLDALAPERRRRRRRAALIIVGAATSATVPSAWMYDAQRTQSEACKGGPARVAEAFSEVTRQGLAESFAGSDLPYAGTSWATTEAAVDEYLAHWEAQYTEACRTTLRGEQSPELLTLRMLCLEHASDEVRYLVTGLVGGSEGAIRDAITTVQSLPDLQVCADVRGLQQQAPPGADTHRLVAGVQAMLARANAAARAGDPATAAAVGHEAIVRAREIDHAPLLAAALLQRARAQVVNGEVEPARTMLEESIVLANRGRADRLAAEAWIDLLFIEASGHQAADLMRTTGRGTRAAVERAGQGNVLLARYAGALALVHARAGRYAEALREQERATDFLRAEYGRTSAAVGVALHRVAELQLELHRLDQADATAQRSAEIIEETHGPSHPRLALPITVRAGVACARAAWSRCIHHARHAAELRIRDTGSIAAAVLPIMVVHARGLAGGGHVDDAVTTLTAAIDLATRSYGVDSPWIGRVEAQLSPVLAVAGRVEEARALAERSVTVLERSLGAAHPDTIAARKLVEGVVVSHPDAVLP